MDQALLSDIPSMNGRQRAQIIIQEILLKQNKQFFTVRVVKRCNRTQREGVKSPFLEIRKTQLDMVLSNLL